MRRGLLALLVFLACKQVLPAISLDCNDPDMVFCMDMAEGSGLVVRDRSKSGISATLNGGPAWVSASAANINWDNPTANPILSTYTYTLPPPRYLQFTATSGEDVTTANLATVGDFSGGKPGMIAVIWKQTTEDNGSNSDVFAYGDGSTGGWIFATAGGGGYPNAAFFTVVVVANYPFKERTVGSGQGVPITDRRPHSYCVWFDGSGKLDLYTDGVMTATYASSNFSASIANQQISFARTVHVGGTEWQGGVWAARIWNKALPREQAAAFFKAFHDSFINQGTGD